MRATVASLALLVMAAVLRSAQSSAPTFSGYMSGSVDTMFAVRWQMGEGAPFAAWLRLGQRAGDFKLLAFDAKRELLSVEDSQGVVHVLALPAGTVRQESLTDEEYRDLYKFLLDGSTWKDAPVLSREKARAFLLRMVRERGALQPKRPEDGEVTFDAEGSTLAPERRATWMQDKLKERARGRLLLVVVRNGKPQETLYPLQPDPVPAQMTRQLLPSDWEEIALLDATFMLRRARR